MTEEVILLVEDSDVLRQGLKSLLEQEDYKVIAGGNGVEALEKMEETTPDLILADILMPEMDGFELLAQIKKSYPEKTCIIMSQTHSHEKRAEELGADAFLAKPFYVDEIFEIVQRYVIQQ